MRLNIAERFLLIAQHSGKGKFVVSDLHIRYGITGALLLQMSLEGKITIEADRVMIKDRKPSSDALTTEITKIMYRFKNPRSIRSTLYKLVGKAGRYKKMLIAQLSKKGYLRMEDHSFLVFIKYKRHYLAHPKARIDLVRQLREELLYDKPMADEDAALLGLIEACNMQKVFASDKQELKMISRKLKERLKENPVAVVVDKTIRQVQAAVLAAIVASTAAAGNSR